MSGLRLTEFYQILYKTHTGKEKLQISALVYSLIFFENSDLYNILLEVYAILNLGYKPSSYLFWKTNKYERLLG